MEADMKMMVAPVQGHTDAAWRHFHHELYGGEQWYCTPFVRLEQGELRPRDLRDVTSPLNHGLKLETQVIFRDMEELCRLLDLLEAEGISRVNLNMGCPFPPQTGKGRGAGFLPNAAEVAKFPTVIAGYPGIIFSAKMRLGVRQHDEWHAVVDALNQVELDYVAIHPRVARQQYGGELDMEQFEALLAASSNPVVFNGELAVPEDFKSIVELYPSLAGLMTARGVLGRPSLIAEVAEGREWTREERLERMISFHNAIFDHYSQTLCGDSQVLIKIKSFWEYAEPEIGHKSLKALKKATTLEKYRAAMKAIR